MSKISHLLGYKTNSGKSVVYYSSFVVYILLLKDILYNNLVIF